MLNSDYRDMLSALSAEGVEFLVVGAFAMAAHGLTRATRDIDFWIRPSRDNAEKTWRALKSFGAPLFDLSIDDLSEPDNVFQIGVAPRRIDLLTAISGVGFDDAWKNRVSVTLWGMQFSVLSREDLIANKLAAGRPKDLVDVAWLQQDTERKP